MRGKRKLQTRRGTKTQNKIQIASDSESDASKES